MRCVQNKLERLKLQKNISRNTRALKSIEPLIFCGMQKCVLVKRSRHISWQSAWQEDIETHQDFQDWQFIHKDGELTFQKADKNLPIVWFASFQDMLGKSTLGGIKTRNEDIHTTNWDCVILDEYHFGAWREHAKELFDREEIDEDEYKEIKESGLEYYDEESMPITTSAYLYLSGTPFRAINSGEFLEDQIFSWTYSDEQRAKEAWGDSPDNPYRELPKMVLLTYQMPEEIQK